MVSAGENVSSSDMNLAATAASNNNNNNNNNNHPNDNNNYGSMIGFPPAFVEDPAAFLTSIASQPTPSIQGLSSLAGPLSQWFRQAEHETANNNTNNEIHSACHFSQLYLCAAATQLRGCCESSPAAAAAAVTSEQQEKQRLQNETLAAVGAAAVLCSDRGGVASSGILPVLAQLMAATASSLDGSSDTTTTNKAFPPLTRAHTAFLQCAVAAELYEFAETVVQGTWPLPTAGLQSITTIRKKKKSEHDDLQGPLATVLRYYYLRGIVHYGCGRESYSMAKRCWWTCLSLPIEYQVQPLLGAIAIEAWKKLTLVHPLLDTVSVDADTNNPMNSLCDSTPLPRCTSNRLTKTIASLIFEGRTNQRMRSYSNKNNNNSNAPVDAVEEDAVVDPETTTQGGESIDRCTVYFDLGPSVQACDRTAAEQLFADHESILREDGNLAMARACLVRVRELQVQTASKRFSVTSLAILARRWKVTPQEASQQLLEARASSVPLEIEADGTVVFGNPTTKQKLVDLRDWTTLMEQLQHMDVDLFTGAGYRNSLKQQKEGKKSEKGGPRGVEDFYGDPAL